MSHKAVSLPVVLVSALLFTGLAADAQNAGADGEFYASSRRPLSDVLKAISAKYGWVISYEDPRYSHVDDIEDVTPPGRSRPALVPRGGAFRYSAPTGDVTGLALLSNVLQAYETHGFAGRFEARQVADGVFSIVPVAIRDATGAWEDQTPVMDTPIALSKPEGSAMALIQELVESVSSKSGYGIIVGTIPINALQATNVHLENTSGRASTILRQILAQVSTTKPLTWRMYYEPTPGRFQGYGLNIGV